MADDADQCVLCRDAATTLENPMCSLVLLQRFAVVEECSVDVGALEADSKRQKVVVTRPDLSALAPLEADSFEVVRQKSHERLRAKLLDSGPPELSLRSCNHTLHMACYHQHFSQFYSRDRAEIRDEGINLDNGEYFCPLCHSLCNAVIPIVKNGVSAEPRAELLSHEELLQCVSNICSSASVHNEHLAVVALRAGMLVWGHPPPVSTLPLLYDAPLAACLADELTRDEGTRDPMMRQMWLGCGVLANACDRGDQVTLKELFPALLGAEAGRLDPLLTFGRLLLALPAHIRAACVAPLFALCGALCLNKQQNYAVLISRAESLLDAVGLSCPLPPRALVEATRAVVKVDQVNMIDTIFSRKSFFEALRFVVSSFLANAGRLNLQLATLPQCLQEKPWFSQTISWKCGVCGTTPAPPRASMSTSLTIFTTCWPGETLSITSWPTARSRTLVMKSRTTGRATSASSSARRTSRSASSTSVSDRRPRVRSRSKTPVNLPVSASNKA